MHSYYNPLNTRRYLLIAYVTSVSHNVCLEKDIKGLYFSHLLDQDLDFFAYNLLMNHRTSLLIAYSTSRSHNELSGLLKPKNPSLCFVTDLRVLTFL